MCAAWARGIVRCLFPSNSKTAFKLTLNESMKSLHCSEACWSWSSSITQTFFQYNRSASIEKYFAMSDCLFLQNDTFTPFSRRFHHWSHDTSSWVLVLGRSSYQIMSFNSAWVMKCGSTLLVPVSSEVSSDSGSESTVYFSGVFCTGIYILIQIGFLNLKVSLSKTVGNWAILLQNLDSATSSL